MNVLAGTSKEGNHGSAHPHSSSGFPAPSTSSAIHPAVRVRYLLCSSASLPAACEAAQDPIHIHLPRIKPPHPSNPAASSPSSRFQSGTQRRKPIIWIHVLLLFQIPAPKLPDPQHQRSHASESASPMSSSIQGLRADSSRLHSAPAITHPPPLHASRIDL